MSTQHTTALSLNSRPLGFTVTATVLLAAHRSMGDTPSMPSPCFWPYAQSTICWGHMPYACMCILNANWHLSMWSTPTYEVILWVATGQTCWVDPPFREELCWLWEDFRVLQRRIKWWNNHATCLVMLQVQFRTMNWTVNCQTEPLWIEPLWTEPSVQFGLQGHTSGSWFGLKSIIANQFKLQCTSSEPVIV